MNNLYLILDATNLCHRAFHTTGGLTYGEIVTGVAYGVIRDIVNLQHRFRTPHTLVCFDYGRSKRHDLMESWDLPQVALNALILPQQPLGQSKPPMPVKVTGGASFEAPPSHPPIPKIEETLKPKKKIEIKSLTPKVMDRLFTPEYKGNRPHKQQDYGIDQKEARKELHRQIRLLRDEILPELGFNNIFYEEGYEADDLIGSLCNTLSRDDEAVLVSTDHDLYQLLAPNIRVWHPTRGGKEYTYPLFKKEWKLEPIQWVNVKALAGCSSDNIQGVPGIGEKTAAKFLRGEVKEGSLADKNIRVYEEIWKRNIYVVRLPYQGTPRLTIKEDEVTLEKWQRVMKRLGIKSMLDSLPLSLNDKQGRLF